MKHLLTILLLILTTSFAYTQCYMERHSTIAEDGWISCDMTPNPNASRGNSHWIMYDLGYEYFLGQSTFWNMNASGRTNEGVKEVVVDYSMDGSTWTEWGTFSLNEAQASGLYEGESGPNFGNLQAQFILLTVLENHGGACVGISEIKIQLGEMTDVEELSEIGIEELQINPNPADQKTQFIFESENNLTATMNITSISGKLIQERKVAINTGQNAFTINTSEFTSGQYIVTLISKNRSASIKLSVIHAN